MIKHYGLLFIDGYDYPNKYNYSIQEKPQHRKNDDEKDDLVKNNVNNNNSSSILVTNL